MDTSIRTLELELIKRNERPSFDYDGVIYLLDTGSNTPVWCSGEDFFLDTYPNARKTEYESHLSGFGNGYTLTKVYVLPNFTLKKDEVEFRVDNLYVAVTDYEKINFDFILPSTLFSKTDYTIANSSSCLKITMFTNRNYVCTPLLIEQEFDKISVWVQGDKL